MQVLYSYAMGVLILDERINLLGMVGAGGAQGACVRACVQGCIVWEGAALSLQPCTPSCTTCSPPVCPVAAPCLGGECGGSLAAEDHHTVWFGKCTNIQSSGGQHTVWLEVHLAPIASPAIRAQQQQWPPCHQPSPSPPPLAPFPPCPQIGSAFIAAGVVCVSAKPGRKVRGQCGPAPDLPGWRPCWNVAARN